MSIFVGTRVHHTFKALSHVKILEHYLALTHNKIHLSVIEKSFHRLMEVSPQKPYLKCSQRLNGIAMVGDNLPIKY